MCLDCHQTSIHTSLIVCIAHFFLEGQDEWALCDRFNIGFRIFGIEDALHSFCFRVEEFRYGTTLDLNMGYYHIELSADSK